MFKRIDDETIEREGRVVFIWNGKPLDGMSGDTVASALIAAGVRANRDHAVTGEPRAPFCMMGTCFECLVEIDGKQNRQGCQVPLVEGMDVRSQKGARG